MGVIFAHLKSENLKEEFSLKITPDSLRELVVLTEEGKLNSNKAKATLEEMLSSGKTPEELLSADDLSGMDISELKKYCEDAISENPKIVSDYRSGKDKAVMALVGDVMRKSKGRADAGKAKEVLLKLLKNQ